MSLLPAPPPGNAGFLIYDYMDLLEIANVILLDKSEGGGPRGGLNYF